MPDTFHSWYLVPRPKEEAIEHQKQELSQKEEAIERQKQELSQKEETIDMQKQEIEQLRKELAEARK